jgi:T5orf172 domain
MPQHCVSRRTLKPGKEREPYEVKHLDRMTELFGSLHPPKGTKAFDELQKHIESTKGNPKIQAAIKKSWSLARSTVVAQMHNGAGRDADETLRYFMADACNRFWTLGVWDSLPASFNVMSDFMEYIPTSNFFRLRQEVDHEFSLASFLDFATSPGATGSPIDVVDLLAEGRVYHFTNIAPLEEMSAGDGRTQRFVLASCSMIRHEDELSYCMVLGQPMHAGIEVAANHANDKIRMRPGKTPLLRAWDGVEAAAEALRGDKQWWKLLLLTRFDLRRSMFQVRYVLRDCGPSFDLLSDDPGIWFDSRENPIVDDWEIRLKANVKKLKQYDPAFELAYYCAFLPKYFTERAACVRPVAVTTQFGQKQPSLKFTRAVASAEPESRVSFRTILRMSAQDVIGPDLTVTPSALRIERSGYWKSLRPDQVGLDRHGNSIAGKTWVSKELTWVELENEGGDLHIQRSAPASGNDPGSIYVMRCAAHPEDVFKIGLTRRNVEERADELGSSTSSLDKFLVVQSWYVGDCVRVESLIHERLHIYRLTSQREFFKVPYSVIRQVVDEIVSRAS